MEVSFNEELFNKIISSINNCVNRYYKRDYPSDQIEFTPCCTLEEKEVLKKAIGIVKQNVSSLINNGTIYTAVILYYYFSIVLEYYIIIDYDKGDLPCLKTHSDTNKLITQITISDEEWVSEIRKLLNNLSKENFLGGKRKKRRKTYRRGSHMIKTYRRGSHMIKSRRHKGRTHRKSSK